MIRLRRLLPLVALLVGAVVGVQALDLVPCADEAVTCHAGADTAQGLDVDCLCHLTFAPLVVVAEVSADPLLAPTRRIGPITCLCPGARQPVERPPIG